MNPATRPVPFTIWEISGSVSLLAAAALGAATADGTAERIGAGVWALVVLGCVWFVIRMHRRRPDLLTQRVPAEILWLIGLVALFFAASAAFADDLADGLVNGLIAFSAAAAIANERTREIPEGTLRRVGSGGYFDQTTARGRARLDRVIRIGIAILTIGCIVLAALGNSWGLFGLFVVGGGAIGFEGMRWFAKRRKLGYYALEDESSTDT